MEKKPIDSNDLEAWAVGFFNRAVEDIKFFRGGYHEMVSVHQGSSLEQARKERIAFIKEYRKYKGDLRKVKRLSNTLIDVENLEIWLIENKAKFKESLKYLRTSILVQRSYDLPIGSEEEFILILVALSGNNQMRELLYAKIEDLNSKSGVRLNINRQEATYRGALDRNHRVEKRFLWLLKQNNWVFSKKEEYQKYKRKYERALIANALNNYPLKYPEAAKFLEYLLKSKKKSFLFTAQNKRVISDEIVQKTVIISERGLMSDLLGELNEKFKQKGTIC